MSAGWYPHHQPGRNSTAATLEGFAPMATVLPMRLLVLAAGYVHQGFFSLMDVTSPAMLPYMGRPLIYITVLNFLKQGGRDVTIVVPEGEKRVEAFLRSAFGTRVALSVVQAPNKPDPNPLQSLEAALDVMTESGRRDSAALIAHGDIYYEVGRFEPGIEPVIFTSAYIDSDKYSSIHVTEGGYEFEEAWAGTTSGQQASEPAQATFTDIGLYYLPSVVTARQALKQTGFAASTVGGLLFRLYGRNIALKNVAEWTDLGHLDTSTRIRTHLLSTRECNHLDIDEMRGLITKRGRNNEKLRQEIHYYDRLPKELTVYFPRMLESRVGKDVSYTIEYYGYKTLSEYLVFYEVPKPVWQHVLAKILSIHKAFRSRAEQQVEPERVYEFYWTKTEKRLDDRARLTAIGPLLDADHVVINGTAYPGWAVCRPAIQRRIRHMAARCTTSVIHGDLCCGNILYDPRTSLIKFIDPRGDFFEEGCHGDPRYDMAKLLHSFHGGYDFILHEMYQLSALGKGAYNLALLRSASARDAEAVLFQLLESVTGYNLQDLLTLEALLFLTMLPFHCEDGKRQAALYLRGLMLLKEAFGEDLS